MVLIGLKEARTTKTITDTIVEKSPEPITLAQPLKKIFPVIEFNAGNLSDSILKTNGLNYNGKRGVYIGRKKKCGLGGNFFNGGIAHRNMELPHTFGLRWYHKLSSYN